MSKIPCVILCGGKSSRMKSDKALLDFNGKSMLEYIYAKMSAFGLFCDVWISTKEDRAYDIKANFILESNKIFTPLCGIANAFEFLKTKEIFILSVDTPLVKRETIKLILNAKNDGVVYVASPNKEHYLISKWNQNMLEKINYALDSNDYKIQNIVKSYNYLTIKIEDEMQFSNLNTPEDYQKAKEHI